MSTIDRRNWLRSTALLTTGLAVAPTVGSWGKGAQIKTSWTKSRVREYYYHPKEKYPELLARLNANENPYGPSDKAKLAIMESVKTGNRYAHGEAAAMRKLLADKEGVSEESIMIAPGSTDILEKVAISHFINGGNVVSGDPAYMSLINTAMAFTADWNKVALTADWAHDLDGMLKAINDETKLVYVCNPNNPTGSLTDFDKLRKFCSKASEKVPVFVDEAYLEFLPDSESKSMVDLVRKGKNVIIARTFSKIHGMAGLRVGYGVAKPETLEMISSMVRSNMGLCRTSLMGAMASLEDLPFQEMSRKLNKECREYTCDSLKKMGFNYIPSHTSFVIFPIEMEGEPFLKEMYGKGVGVRAFEIDGKPHCRVSIGKMEEMELFVKTLKKVLMS